MSEKIKTAVMEVIKAHMDGEDKNTKAVLSDVMESVNELDALSQEPTEKPMTVDEMEREYEKSKALFHKIVECEDAVSRMALGRSKMCEDIDCYNCPFWVIREGQRICRLSEYVKDLPSVTQKSETVTEFADRCRECGKMRKGHWIYDETLENWRCSKCNETPKTMGYVGTADFMAEHFKFCNHCGAKMESEDKE